MKKSVLKALCIALCAVLTLGGLGGAMYAMNATGSPAPVPGPEKISAKAAAAGGERNTKDETVYVWASADGAVEKIIVSNWVHNTQGSDAIDDVTRLTDIENVKGDERFTLGGDNTCVWDARGNDIYYQGSPADELPVSVAVSYTLDGQPVTPKDLAGRSGRVAIRFDYTNHQYEMVDIGGRQEKIYVPFAILTGVVLDNGMFSNVSVSNGKLINDGDRTIVAGLAFPGLQDSLGLERDTLDLPDYIEISADAERFELGTTVTLATNGLFNDAANQAGSYDKLDDVDGKLNELTDAMEQLMDGSSRLYDGLCTLLDSSKELTSGIDRLTAGAAQLQEGAKGLSTGADQLQSGAAALSQGLEQLARQNDALNDGAAQVFQSLLASASAQLRAAGVETPDLTAENYAQVLDGIIASAGQSPAGQQVAALKGSLDNYRGFYQGLQNYTDGVAQASAGAGELNTGIGAVKNGADSLQAGMGQLYDGILNMQSSAPALIDGVTELRDGTMELSEGLKEFNEQGVQRLADVFSGDLSGLADRVDAVKAVSERYTSFSGISPDMDGLVKFLWRTEAVKEQKQ